MSDLGDTEYISSPPPLPAAPAPGGVNSAGMLLCDAGTTLSGLTQLSLTCPDDRKVLDQSNGSVCPIKSLTDFDLPFISEFDVKLRRC